MSARDRNGNDVRLARRPDPVFPIWDTTQACRNIRPTKEEA